MNKIDTIIFDLGGVLIDWDPKNLYRKIFTDEDEMEWFLDNVCDMKWNLQQDAGRTWKEATSEKILQHPAMAQQILAYHSRWSEMLNGQIQGTVDIFKRLKDKNQYKIYALTNWSHETFPIAEEQFVFLKWFDGIVVSGQEKTRKPFPDIYNILLDRYNITAQRALFIDDNNCNIEAARSLDIQAIHFIASDKLERDLKEVGVL